MMPVITISREFGSGGRELGKRMADLLNISYYDREIITAVARRNQMDEGYVSTAMEKGLSGSFPIPVGRTFSYPAFVQNHTPQLLADRQRIIRELAAQGDCVMLGQGADIILQEHRPLNLFVYADMSSKIRRCRQRGAEDEVFTESQLIGKIGQVDAGRSKVHELLSNRKWGAKENYHLCINTTGNHLKALAPQIADYTKYWFGLEKS